jgi:hypothetical protein
MTELSVPRRGGRLLAATLAVYVALTATHLGEFWPFSIYPMFSIAGGPWTRAIVRDLSDVEPQDRWRASGFRDLPGRPVVLPDLGVDQIDFSNYMSKSVDWDADRLRGLRSMFTEQHLAGRTWMVYKVSGRMVDGDEVDVTATPFLLLTTSETRRNPNLPADAYGTPEGGL